MAQITVETFEMCSPSSHNLLSIEDLDLHVKKIMDKFTSRVNKFDTLERASLGTVECIVLNWRGIEKA